MENINYQAFLINQSEATDEIKLGRRMYLTSYTCNYYNGFILHLPDYFPFLADASQSAKLVTVNYVCVFIPKTKSIQRQMLKISIFQETEYYALCYCKWCIASSAQQCTATPQTQLSQPCSLSLLKKPAFVFFYFLHLTSSCRISKYSSSFI